MIEIAIFVSGALLGSWLTTMWWRYQLKRLRKATEELNAAVAPMVHMHNFLKSFNENQTGKG
jgi:hypothetical protein